MMWHYVWWCDTMYDDVTLCMMMWHNGQSMQDLIASVQNQVSSKIRKIRKINKIIYLFLNNLIASMQYQAFSKMKKKISIFLKIIWSRPCKIPGVFKNEKWKKRLYLFLNNLIASVQYQVSSKIKKKKLLFFWNNLIASVQNQVSSKINRKDKKERKSDAGFFAFFGKENQMLFSLLFFFIKRKKDAVLFAFL